MSAIRTFVLFMLLLSSSWGACAAQPSTESVETLLRASKMESLLESIYANTEAMMRQAMAQAVAGRTLTPEQKRFLDNAPRRFTAVMREELSWANLKPIYVRIYRENFTQEEIDGLVAFYGSPAGQAYVDKMPVVMRQSMLAMQERIKPYAEKMKEAVEQAISESRAVK